MKKIVLILLLIICIFMTGCGEKKEKICSIENEDKEVTVTITVKTDKTIIKTDTFDTHCDKEGLCRVEGNTKEEETEDSFDSVVDKYKNDGYYCE